MDLIYGELSAKRSNEVKDSIVTNNEDKKPRMKSVVFVPLEGLSQSKKDRLMNNRTVRRPPKNIDLVEEDPVEDVDLKTEIKVKKFPTERKLSSKIKKANSGIDYSNHSIEEYYNQHTAMRQACSNASDSTNSGTITSDVLIEEKASLNEVGLTPTAKIRKKGSKSDVKDKKKTNKLIPDEKVSSKNDSSTTIKEGFGLESKSKKIADTETHLCLDNVTPRQRFILEGLNEEKFQFVPKTVVTGPPEPKSLPLGNTDSTTIDATVMQENIPQAKYTNN